MLYFYWSPKGCKKVKDSETQYPASGKTMAVYKNTRAILAQCIFIRLQLRLFSLTLYNKVKPIANSPRTNSSETCGLQGKK